MLWPAMHRPTTATALAASAAGNAMKTARRRCLPGSANSIPTPTGFVRLRAKIIEDLLPLATHLAARFRNRGEPFDDLVQVANLALIKAVDGFDPDRGVSFSSYAVPFIAGELKRHFRDKTWHVRVPRRLQELSLQINRATDELTQQLGRSPTVADLARHLEIGEEETIEALEAAGAYHSLSLDAPAGGEDGAKHAGGPDRHRGLRTRRRGRPGGPAAAAGDAAGPRAADPGDAVLRQHDPVADRDRAGHLPDAREPSDHQGADDAAARLAGRVALRAGQADGGAAAAPGAEVVADHVPAEVLDVRGEHPAAAAPGHRVDEPAQARVLAEHEHVERRAVPGELVDLAHGRLHRLRAAAASGRTPSPSSSRCAVGSPSVTTRTTGSAPECRRRCRPASCSACCRLVPCTMSGSTAASSPCGQRHRVPAEPDDLQRVLREPGGDQVRQRQRGLLHRAPAALGDHRERQVDAERHRRRRPPLGLDHLEVLDRQLDAAPDRGRPPDAARPPHRVADRAHHVERLLVAELPAPRRAGQLAGRAGVAQVVLPAPAGLEVGEDPRAARCRRAGAAPSGSASSPSAPRVTQPCRRSSRSSSRSRRTSSAARPAELPLHRLDVDVVQGRAGVLLAELVEQVVEVGDLAERAGRLAVAERPRRRGPARRGPRQVGPQRAQVRR